MSSSLRLAQAWLWHALPCAKLPLSAIFVSLTVRTAPIQGQPLPPDYGPPPYEAPQPGFLPPHVPGEGPMPMPMPMPMPQPPPGAAHCLQSQTLSNTQSRQINVLWQREDFQDNVFCAFGKNSVFCFSFSCHDFTRHDVMPENVPRSGFFVLYWLPRSAFLCQVLVDLD